MTNVKHLEIEKLMIYVQNNKTKKNILYAIKKVDKYDIQQQIKTTELQEKKKMIYSNK